MDDPYINKLAAVVRNIYHSTQNGKISWSLSTTGPDDFETEVSGKRITVGRVDYIDEDGDQMNDIEIAIFDNAGRKVESIRDPRLSGVGLGLHGFSGWYALMTSIYETARRKVDGSETAIDDILTSLTEDMPF